MTGSRTSRNFLNLEKGPLIIPGEGDRDLAVSQRLLRGRLYREDFTQGQLLRTLGGESAISAEDDVDDVLQVLEIDEDISPLHTMQGLTTRARARQLDLHVRSNLVNCFSELTLGSMHVLLIRNNGEDQQGLGEG
jgi:hypothetical protein